MSRLVAMLATVAGICCALFALAFAMAPRSCNGGLEIYFWSGVVALCAMLVLPFAFRIGASLLVRSAWTLGLVILGAGTWLGGLFAANVRFLCGLM